LLRLLRRFSPEEHHSERREVHLDRPFAAVAGDRLRFAAAAVADVRAAVEARVAVEDLAIVARAGDADPVVEPRHGSEAEAGDRDVAALASTQKGEKARLPVVEIDPFEAAPFEVDLMERGRLAIHTVQVAHEAIDASVPIDLEEMPIDALVAIPFASLSELSALEEELLPRVRPLISKEEPEVREFLPRVSWHLVEEGPLAVHDFVMRERQHEVLGERVEKAEGEVVLVIAAVDRVLREVLERVVHPPHVPLHAE